MMNPIEQFIRKELSSQSVCIHSSFHSLKGLVETPKEFLTQFLDQDCTVMAPTFSFEYNSTEHAPEGIRPSRNGWDYLRQTQNPKIAEPFTRTARYVDKDMGAIPKCLLEFEQAVRGNHPLCSFSAVGPDAGHMMKMQSYSDVFAPLRILAESNGYVLLVGVGFESMTLIHLAEQLTGRNLFVRWARGEDGKVVGVSTGGCSDGFANFTEPLMDLIHKIKFGASEWMLVPAKPALDKLIQVIGNDPHITKCKNPHCPRCRDAVLGGPIWK